MFDIFGTKVLENIGLFVPNTMMSNLEYIMTLPASSTMLSTQANHAAANYSLENLELEYETITNPELARDITNMFSSSVSIPLEHVTMFRKISWAKANTVQKITVNIPHKSMKGIVLLFKDDSTANEKRES